MIDNIESNVNKCENCVDRSRRKLSIAVVQRHKARKVIIYMILFSFNIYGLCDTYLSNDSI